MDEQYKCKAFSRVFYKVRKDALPHPVKTCLGTVNQWVHDYVSGEGGSIFTNLIASNCWQAPACTRGLVRLHTPVQLLRYVEYE